MSAEEKSRRGTSLIVLSASEGTVMAADDLVYVIKNGKPLPISKMKKVFAVGSVLIGSAGTVCYSRPSIKYKFDDWISQFVIKHRGATLNEPRTVADAIYADFREIVQPIEELIKSGDRHDYAPGDRIINYLVAGYPQNFKYFHLIELGAELNANGDGVVYIPPFHPKTGKGIFNVRLGEDKFISRALEGIIPEAGVREREGTACLEKIAVVMPKTPETLQDMVASAVSLIKVEAEFNPNKVGKNVNVVCVDRIARKTYRVAF